MRREHQRVAIAVDEHGLTTGMVTFEDLVEEIVGEVFSEHEEHGDALVLAPDGSAVVKGEVPIREVNRALGLALEEAEGVGTVAGLCIQLAGGIPNRNARLAANDGVVLVVLDSSLRAVRRVRIIPPPRPPVEVTAEGERRAP
jgi:putative hemolysin